MQILPDAIYISIIVPIYKVEIYIRECIDSILSQTYQHLEIILVDDGSPDNCPLICDHYALQDKRVKVIHKKNGGLSDARNAGLKEATGDYILFIDSDDYWSPPTTIEELVNILQQTAKAYDFICFNCQYYYQRDHLFKPCPPYPETVTNYHDYQSAIVSLIASGLFPMSACTKLIKKDFLIRNNIRFIKDLTCEDIPWFIEVLTSSHNFKFINQYYYIYRKQTGNSISSSFSEKKYNDLFSILKNEIKNIQTKIINPEVRNALLSFMAYEYCTLIGTVNNFPRHKRKQQFQKLEKYKWILQYNLNPKVRKVKLLLRLTGAHLTRWALSFYIKKRVNRI